MTGPRPERTTKGGHPVSLGPAVSRLLPVFAIGAFVLGVGSTLLGRGRHPGLRLPGVLRGGRSRPRGRDRLRPRVRRGRTVRPVLLPTDVPAARPPVRAAAGAGRRAGLDRGDGGRRDRRHRGHARGRSHPLVAAAARRAVVAVRLQHQAGTGRSAAAAGVRARVAMAGSSGAVRDRGGRRRRDQGPAAPAPGVGAAASSLAGGRGRCRDPCRARGGRVRVHGPRRLAAVRRDRDPRLGPDRVAPERDAGRDRLAAGRVEGPRGRAPGRDDRRGPRRLRRRGAAAPGRGVVHGRRDRHPARVADPVGPLRDRAPAADGVAARPRPALGDGRSPSPRRCCWWVSCRAPSTRWCSGARSSPCSSRRGATGIPSCESRAASR